MKRNTTTMAAMMLTLTLALPAAAQGPLAQKRAALKQQVTDYMIQQLTQQVPLDAPTATRVREIWVRYQDQIEGVHREQGMIMKELKSLLAAAQPNDARLTQLSDQALANKLKVEQLDNQRALELRRVLTPVQLAKVIVISPALRRQVQQQFWKAMQEAQAQQPAE